MATELGQAYVQIMPSAKGISGSIRSQLDPEASSAGKSAGFKISSGLKTAVVAGAAALATAVGVVVKGAITEGSKLQQSLGGVETLFKGSAGKVKKYANDAYRTTGLSANAYMENVTSFSASLLQSMGGNTAKAADKANMAMVDMSDNANKMGTNIGDIQNAYQGFAKQNYTMLDNLKLGYGGTQEEMKRLLADATKISGVKYDMSNLSDVYSAIHVIQKNLGITGTTAKEAATTFEGSFNSMKASAQNVLGNLALGRNIAPSLNALAQTTSTFLFKNFIPMVGNILKGLPSAIGTFIQAAIPEVMSAGKSLMSQMGIGMSSGVSESLSSLTSTITPIIATIKNALASMDFSGIQNFISALIPAITAGFSTMMSIVGPAISGVVQSFVGLWNAAQPLISVLAGALMPVFQILGSFLGGVLKGILMGISATFDAIKVVIQVLTPVVSFLVGVFKSIAPALSTVAKWVGTVIGLFSSFGSAGTTLKSLLTSAWNNIKSVVSGAGSIIKTVISAIKTAFKSAGSAGGALKGILSSAWNGIKAVISTVGGAIGGVIGRIKSFFSGLSSAGHSMRSAVSGVWNGMKSVISGVASTISGIISKVKSVFHSLGNINLSSAGSAIMRGFLGGLKGAYGAVKNFVGGIASWIKKHKGPISYDRRLLIPAGNAIMDSLNDGLLSRFSSVKNTVSSISGEVTSQLQDATNTMGTSQLMATVDMRSRAENNHASEMSAEPIFEIHNEIVGDEIYTSVKTKESRKNNVDKFFKR